MPEVRIPFTVLPAGWELDYFLKPESKTVYAENSGGRYEVTITMTDESSYTVALTATDENPYISEGTDVLSADGLGFHTATAAAIGMMQADEWYEQAELEYGVAPELEDSQ